MSSDSVVLEVFFVRFPFGDAAINGDLWQEVDEQHFSPEVRNRLMQNGFRMGVIGGQIPMALSKLMELADKPPRASEAGETQLANLEDDPRVLRRHLQIRAGQRGEILASRTREQLPVLLSESGQVCGEIFAQAQAVFALKPYLEGDGGVRLELTPELYHDEPRQRWVPDQGTFRLEAGRPRKSFDMLAVTATLSPGTILLLSSLPSRPGSLGHHYLTDDYSRPEQKLLLIRLAQTQHDGLFSPPQVLQLEEP